MRFEDLLFEWAFMILLGALILGGQPWRFPKNGQIWIEQFEKNEPHTNSFLFIEKNFKKVT